MGFWGILALQMIWKQRYLMKHRLPVGEEEPWPGEPLEEYRQHTRHVFTKKVKEYALRQFLDLDGKVLRFFCVWDDRQVPYGERRPYVCFFTNPCCPWALPPMQRLEWDCFLSSLYANLDFIFITRVYNFFGVKQFNHMFLLALLVLIPSSNFTCTLPIFIVNSTI